MEEEEATQTRRGRRRIMAQRKNKDCGAQ